MNRDFCTRDVTWTPVEREGSGDPGDGRTIEGYAAVFDSETVIDSPYEGRFVETIAKGAFRKTLRERRVVQMQYNHGNDQRVGTVPIGHYTELREDDHGLYGKGRLFDNDLVEPIRQAIEAGAITGQSFKFRVVRDDWHDNVGRRVKPDDLYQLLYEPGERGPLKRTIKEVQLFEAGPVSTPAYAATSVGVREVTDENRQALVDQYRASVAAEQRELQDWLDAEERWARDYSDWVAAETTWRTATTDWLAAEQAHETSQRESDAAHEGTSERVGETPQPTPPDLGTSHRDNKKDTEQRDAAPRKVRKVMNLHELRALEKKLLATITGLGDEFRDAEMPEDKTAEFDAAKAEVTSVRAKIAAIEARAEEIKSYAVSTPSATERSFEGTPAFHRDRDIFDTEATRLEAKSPEDYVARLQDDAKKAVDKARFARVAGQAQAQERAMELLETYDDDAGTLAKRILVTGSALYERAFGKALRSGSLAGLSMEEQRAMSLGGGSGSEGGYAVPFQLDPTVILTNDGYTGSLRNLARVETIVGKEWQGITSSGITVSRDGTPGAGEIGRTTEGAEASDGSFTLGQPTVKATRVQGFVPFSIEIEQDWGGLRSEITRMLADAKDREEMESFTLGDPVAVVTQPGGVVGSLTGGSVIPQVGAEGTFTAADVYALELALAPRWRANGRFMANRATYSKIRQFATADGHDLWERIGNGLPSRLLGYEAVENSYMDASAINAAATADHKILLFGDFGQFLIVDRVGMNIELVPHVFGAAGRPTGQRGVYAVWRNNAKVLVPNAFRLINVATTA